MHHGRVVGNKVIAILTVLRDDRVSGSPLQIDLVTGTVAAVDVEQALANCVGAEVTNSIAPLAEGGCGGDVVEPRVREDLLDGDSASAAWIKHS